MGPRVEVLVPSSLWAGPITLPLSYASFGLHGGGTLTNKAAGEGNACKAYTGEMVPLYRGLSGSLPVHTAESLGPQDMGQAGPTQGSALVWFSWSPSTPEARA